MKTIMKYTLLLLSLLGLSLFFSPSILAEMQSETIDDVAIHRAAPAQAPIGQKIWINIILENNANVVKNITVIEKIGNADFDQSEAKSIKTPYGETFWYYEWKIKLPAKGNVAIGYWLIPKQIGSYVISPAQVDVDGKTFYLEPWSIEIRCLSNGKCDTKLGENYLTCPQDCTTGLADGICDSAADGRCDPDCEQAFDPDCKAGKAKIAVSKNLILYVVAGVVLVIIVIVVVALLVRRKAKPATKR